MENKYCVNCRYIEDSVTEKNFFGFNREYKIPLNYCRCKHPKLLDKVAGKPTAFCSVERKYSSSFMNHCGEDGTFFEPKGVK